MRFKSLLPILQSAAMFLTLWAPWNPKAHDAQVGSEQGIILQSEAGEWAEGINLPASAIVTPAEFAIRKPDALPNLKVKFCGFWLLGFVCWYMVGRFFDDLIQWRRARHLPRKNAVDVAFALIAAPSAALLASVPFSGVAKDSVLFAWRALWIIVTGSALLFRFAQFFRENFKPPAS